MNLIFHLKGFFSDHKKVLCLAAILGIILSVITIIFADSIYTDATLYTNMAYAFSIGDWQRAFLKWIPPLFPALAGLICKAGIPAYYATLGLGCLFYVLTIFPLYYFLTTFTDNKRASWGCLFYILTPKIIRLGCAGLLDGGRNFFIVLSLCLLFSFFKNKRIYKLIYLGISLACLSLIRGEGIIFLPLALFCLILLSLREHKYKITFGFFKDIVIYCCLTFVVCLAALSPRMYQVYLETGYPVTDYRMVSAVKGYFDVINQNQTKVESKAIIKGTQKVSDTEVKNISNSRFTFDYLGRFINDFSRGTYELYEILLALGLILLLYRRKWTLEHSILILFLVLNAAVFYFVSIAYRYFIVNVLLLMPFTLTGYGKVIEISEKFKVKYILILATLIIAVFQMINGLENSIAKSKLSQKSIGAWIAANRTELRTPGSDSPFTVLSSMHTPQFAFWSHSNSCTFKDYKQAELEQKLIELINYGCSAEKMYAVRKLLPDEKNVKPDIIVIENNDSNKLLIDYLKTLKKLKYLNTKWDNRIAIFKVMN